MLDRIARGAVALTIMLGLAILTMAWAGCGASARQKTLHATLIAVDAARDGFVEYDKQRQISIVESSESHAAAVERLAAYRTDRAPIVEAFAQVYKLLATAALLEEDRSLTAALAAAKQLAETLAAFGCERCKP